MQAGILSGRRLTRPFGLAGGQDGEPGVNRVERAGGGIEQLGPSASSEMQPGDVFAVETPGGGGYGR
jgi:5-oxoprolinase (ATP-hydrolysing)